MHPSLRDPITSGPGSWRRQLVAVLVSGTVAASSAAAQSLQTQIDLAAPGDTVLVPAGDYLKRITVDKAITLLASGPGTPRLVGLTGSQATVVGLTLDGSLSGEAGTLVEAGSDLTLTDCTFVKSIRGATVLDGAERVRFDHCLFNAPVEAVSLAPGAVSATFQSCTITGSAAGISGTGTFPCIGTERMPAERCASGGCGRLEIADCTFSGGESHVQLYGSYVLAVRDSRLENAVTAIQAQGVRLELENVDIVSAGGVGTGLDLASVSGFVRGCRILSWKEAIVIGDGSCPLYSDPVFGGSLQDANDIGGDLWNLRVTQPEAVTADANFWGTLDCNQVQAKISGQKVAEITDYQHLFLVPCDTNPASPTTWGRLKARYGGTAPHE